MSLAAIITGNAELTSPLGILSLFMHSGEGDLASLKTITDTFSVPAHALAGGGTIGSQRANLSDDQIELCIRDWTWRHCNWTGTLQVTAPVLAANRRALDIYNWMQTNVTLNAGKGPTMDCGNVAALYVGFLAAYGIAARRVWGRDLSGNVDFTCEYWSPSKGGWIHTLPHMNGQVNFNSNGAPASFFEWVMVERTAGSRVGIADTVYVGASTGVNLLSGIAETWYNYSAAPAWERGNRVQFSGGSTGDPLGYTSQESMMRVVAPLNSVAGDTTINIIAATARHLNDAYFAVNALHLNAERRPTGMIYVALEHTMLDFSKFQAMRPGQTSWDDMDANGSYAFWPVSGQTWKFRALGVLGNTSNTVSVTIP